MPRQNQDETDRFLLIADISGYTEFVFSRKHDLRHAQYVISELLDSLLTAARLPMRLAKLEGDAAFFQAPTGSDGNLAMATSLEYFFPAFDARRAALQEANSCGCSACMGIGHLDLKIVAHRGPVLSYALHGFQELSGPAVILVHRLLKNSVRRPRYMLLSEDAWQRLPGSFTNAVASVPHEEAYDDAGNIRLRLVVEPSFSHTNIRPEKRSKTGEFLRKGWRSLWIGLQP